MYNQYSATAKAEKEKDERENGIKLFKGLVFKYVELDEEYRKKWNERSSDFGNLYKDGKKVSDNLYRIGGIGGKAKDGYIILLKYIEDYYDLKHLKTKAEKRHLQSHSCIINENGIEKIVADSYKHPYLQGGLIYALDSNYYNIESGELISHSHKSMSSDEFIFLDNAYDNDKSKCGVLKVRKSDGTYELFKGK